MSNSLICPSEKVRRKFYISLLLITIFCAFESNAQIDRRLPNLPRPNTGGSTNRGVTNSASASTDSLKHRTGLEDSITIRFRYLDSSRLYQFDSSLYDFTYRFPVPPSFYTLGNLGNAANNYLFSPILKSGWDPGFHAFDIYKFSLHETRLYNTTRPYSELGYVLGSKSEQMINLIHSQNIKPYWNVAFQYRLINSPGFLQNHNANHNNYRLNSWYQSPNKRYSNFFVLVANTLNSSENGGIRNDIPYLDSSAFKDRSGIPVKLGAPTVNSTNFFTTRVGTGNKYRETEIFLRQQYDIGQKDSLVMDTVVIPLFYPRLRLEHSIKYGQYRYRFEDNSPDSFYYASNYQIDTTAIFFLQDSWKELLNDFSFYTFPDRKNPQQYLKLGASIQNLSGSFDSSGSASSWSKKYYNFFGHAEYRNRSKNQKWDIEAFGSLYFAGLNAGDYEAYISLKRLVSKKAGSLQIGFRNTNRTPSFVFNTSSAFWKEPGTISFNKENLTTLFASIEQPGLQLRLTGQYTLISNYTYFSNYNKRSQETGIFNILQIGAEKVTNLSRRWILRSWLVFQQKAGSSPINIPLLFTRNMIGYEGNLGFKNLNTAFGLELKYHTNFRPNGYSPLMGQFFVQDNQLITRNLPEISAYVHFRIKTFTAYVRAENLNSLRISGSNSGFTNNNLVAPDYPSPGLLIRVGIFWTFVN